VANISRRIFLKVLGLGALVPALPQPPTIPIAHEPTMPNSVAVGGTLHRGRIARIYEAGERVLIGQVLELDAAGKVRPFRYDPTKAVGVAQHSAEPGEGVRIIYSPTSILDTVIVTRYTGNN